MKNTMKKPVAIPVEKLRPFAGHPFKVKDDDEMNALIESIQTQGVLSPLIVRPIENTEEYEVISGHRRLHAAQKAGITEIPALIYALDRDAAAIAVVDSNLHREHILPSEKAFAYKMKYEAMKHQGTSCQLGTKLRTDEQIAEKANDSARQIQRYIRLTHLIPELLEFMDENRMALSVCLSLLPPFPAMCQIMRHSWRPCAAAHRCQSLLKQWPPIRTAIFLPIIRKSPFVRA